MCALCVLQRDDKLKRGIESRAAQRTKQRRQGGACFSADQDPGEFGQESKRKEREEKQERGGPQLYFHRA